MSAGVFATRADALASLAVVETDLRRGLWVNPRAGKIPLERYAAEWLATRNDLAARTRELYEHVLARYIAPSLGRRSLVSVSPSQVRTWNAEIARIHPATAAKAYRLLSSIMRTAVVDGLITASPCKVRGAGQERSAERPVASVAEVEALRQAMPEHLRVVVGLAAWCQLRRGEILGLRRGDVDESSASIHIHRSVTFLMDGTRVEKEPKTRAGSRVVAVPTPVMAELSRHLKRYCGRSSDSPVITALEGGTLTRDALQSAWKAARSRVGRPDLRLHDLRHTGLTIAAAAGATPVELMHRAGHASSAAAMRYQHAVRDRDRVLADALGRLVEEGSRAVPGRPKGRPGTKG
ncbi:MAG TPA: tyrosine-type recombinase/integrase [Acidimicrobiales bacterium]|nr:tyrosine-type recombinase/integrase [Acidimicrobiales bacterium]